MRITEIIEKGVIEAVKELYGADITPADITMNVTRKEFEGDYTVVTFPFARLARKKPQDIAQELGDWLVARVPQIGSFNVIQGFLNLSIAEGFWRDFVLENAGDERYGLQPRNGRKVLVEFCSPNTNKPLHLGHIRNILLGWSCSRLYEAAGFDVVKVQIINDRGIAICKSMLAWQKWANGATPQNTGVKPDHFVGDYYVLFEKKFQEEYQAWQQTEQARRIYEEKKKEGQTPEAFFKEYKNTYFNEHSELGRQARSMLQRWEAGDEATLALWKQMNDWVYEGFEETYRKLGVRFDKYYYESETYLLGKALVEEGLRKGIFYKKEDGSVWVDLTDVSLDHKLLLRSDGTSVYITQDLGTARIRYEDFHPEKMIYVVADEQNYHFQVLFEVLRRLGEPYADGLYHLSYGMVDLPTGKMKSREGTVVDADDLIAEVEQEARTAAEERGEITSLPKAEQEQIIHRIALAALKFHIIKVSPRKRMVFDPRESLDLQGQTGPYVQNAYVRIKSVLRKAEQDGIAPSNITSASAYAPLQTLERELVQMLYQFPGVVIEAANQYDPSAVANYCYDLARCYHKFYTDHSILRAESVEARDFRLLLSQMVARTLQTGMDLLGIEMVERM